MTLRRKFRLYPRPELFAFEDRVVPAAYFVDNAFIGKADGTVVTFNAGQPNQVTGLVIGQNAFAKFSDAINKANGDVEADTINFANGIFTVDQAANLGAFAIVNPLDFVGSGKGVTTLKSVSDTVDAGGTNGALFVAQNTKFNVSNLTLDGGTNLAASGFRFENSTGTVSSTLLQNISDLSGSSSIGYPIVAVAGSNVTISGNTILNNGRGGIRFDNGAKGTVTNNTITGRGGLGPLSINFGVDLTRGSSAVISGNVITGFTGSTGNTPADLVSAAIQVIDGVGTADPSNATILGNTLSGNNTGVIIGLGGGDASTATINYNNIINNANSDASNLGSGVFADTTQTVDALFNFWGKAEGPLAPDNPTGEPTASVSAGVTYKAPGTEFPPNGILTAQTAVVVGNTPADVLAQISPTVTITGPNAPTGGPINLTITFSSAVTGFTAADIAITGNAGTGTVTKLTTTDNKTFTATVTGLNKRGTVTATVPANSAAAATGIGNLAGTTDIAFQPVFDRGFGTSGDSGIVTPVIGVTDTFTTRFNQTPFGAAYTGGTRVATADLNGDGTLDYIVGSGGGIITEVRAFNGVDNSQIFSIVPFGNTFTRGAYVAAGDLTGDGLAEILITAERGGGARIRIFSPNAAGAFNQIADFIGIIGSNGVPDTVFRGGARAAVGDVNGDGRGDLIFAAGTGGGPRIAIFDGSKLGTNGGPKLTGDFFVFEPTLRNGSFPASGDVNGDGKADLIVGAGNGASRLRVISGAQLIASNGLNTASFADYFAFSKTSGGGVRVDATDLDGDGKADVIAGEGPGTGSRIRTYSATNILANGANPAVSKELSLFGAFTGGVFVG